MIWESWKRGDRTLIKARKEFSDMQARIKELEEENSIMREALTDRAVHIESINLSRGGEFGKAVSDE